MFPHIYKMQVKF